MQFSLRAWLLLTSISSNPHLVFRLVSTFHELTLESSFSTLCFSPFRESSQQRKSEGDAAKISSKSESIFAHDVQSVEVEMVRPNSKVQLKLIENPRQRKITFQKRKDGFKKKARELAVLCDVSVMASWFNPYTGKVESWPENEQAARDIIERYQSLSSTACDKDELDSTSSMKNESCELHHNDSQEAEMQSLDSTIKLVRERIEFLQYGSKDAVPKESLEQKSFTFWQELMRDAIGSEDLCEPSTIVDPRSVYNDGSPMNHEFDLFSECTVGTSAWVFDCDHWVADCRDFEGFADAGRCSMRYQADGLLDSPLTSSTDAWEIKR